MFDDFKSHISTYTLRFKDIRKEADYEKYLVHKSLLWFRFALFSGVFFYMIYSIVDYVSYPEIASTFLWIRIALMTPVFLIAILISNKKWYLKRANKLNILSIFLAGFGVLLLSYIGRNEPNINRNYVGVIMAFIYLYNFLRVQFVNCSIIGGLLLIASILVEIFVIQAPFDILISNVFFLVMANFICLFTCYLLEYQYRKEYYLKDQMKVMSGVDALTGLHNRHYYHLVVEKEINKAYINFDSDRRRKGDVVEQDAIHYGMVMIDIDFFKDVNDEFGHFIGDVVLSEFASLLENSVRRNDYIIRWGGEEFLIILSHTDTIHIKSFVARLGKKIEEYVFDSTNKKIHLTCSMGCLNIPFCTNVDLDKIIGIADKALYKAKADGRNHGRYVTCQGDHQEDDRIEYTN